MGRVLRAIKSRLKKLLIQQSHAGVCGRAGERGNVFFALFGAVAIVGVLGAGIMATMRGPLSTMVDVNRIEQAKSEVRLATSLILVGSSDDDADGYTEGVDPSAVGTYPVGGGVIPASVSANKTDPWGNAYGYCAWDLGTSFAGYNNLLAGQTDVNNIAIAVISAGPDGVFQTSCVADNSGTNDYVEPDGGGGDDIVEARTYNDAIAGSGGLWTPDDLNNEADIARDLDVSAVGTSRFAGSVQAATSMITDALEPITAGSYVDVNGGIKLGDVTTGCAVGDAGALRINSGVFQMCNGSAWAPAGGLWSLNGSDAYYMAGNVGIGLNNPNDALDVVGTAQITGNVALGASLTVTANYISSNGNLVLTTGNATFGGTLGVGGATTLSSTLGVTGATTLSSTLGVTGATTLSSTLDVTGATTLQSTLDAQGAISNSGGDVTVDDALVVTGTSDLQGNVSDSAGDLTLDDDTVVTGTLDVTGDATFGADIIVQTADSLIPPNCAATEKLEWGSTGGWTCEDETAGPGGAGVAINLGDLNDVTTSGPASDECLVYDGAKWVNSSCTSSAGVIWENSANVIRVRSAATNYATDDFVFGSPQLADDGNTAHDRRMFFDKSKAAFRAGRVLGAQWDDASVGDQSVAMGDSTTASGDYSFAMGRSMTASGENSVAMGYSSTASAGGLNAFTQYNYLPALSTANSNRRTGSFVLGTSSTASGAGSVALGESNTASSTASVSIGYSNTASGAGSVALGQQTTASGANGLAMGLNAQALGVSSVAVGEGVSVSGDNSFGFGLARPSTTPFPDVSGASSFGIFMGDQNGYDLSASNTMALIGGELMIDDDGSSAASKGCIKFNDGTGTLQFSHDCTTYSSFGSVAAGAIAIDDLSDAAKDLTNNNLFMAHEGGAVGANNDYNTGIGIGALISLNDDATAGAGDYNTALGYNALNANTLGSYNTAQGVRALGDTSTGERNTALGYQALKTNVAKSRNTAVGYDAMHYADDDATPAATYNTAMGYEALFGSTTAANNTGTYNTALGALALREYVGKLQCCCGVSILAE